MADPFNRNRINRGHSWTRGCPLLLAALPLATSLAAGAPVAGAPPMSNAPVALPGDMGRPLNGLPLPPNPPPPPPPRPLAKAPSIDTALAIAKAAVQACQGFHVGVSVIDASGAPKLFYIPDGTDGSHAYTALRKAYTALTFRMPTSQVGELTKRDAGVAAQITADTNLLSFAGGVPLRAGEELIGAIGVSGAEPSAKDEECARVAIDQTSAGVRHTSSP